MMQYNIENSFSKLRKMPTAKVEVKKEGNITEVKSRRRRLPFPRGWPRNQRRISWKWPVPRNSSSPLATRALASPSPCCTTSC